MVQLSGEASPIALAPPHGLDEICATFGDIFGYIAADHTLDAEWQSDFLARVVLPFPMTISWDHSRTVRAITCHKMLGGVFGKVLSQIQSRGLQNKVTSFGGCFSFRPQRTGTKLSTHALGDRDRLESGEQRPGKCRRHESCGDHNFSRSGI
jgi:hypothetical protein